MAKFWIDLEITRLTRIEIEAKNQSQAENRVCQMREADVNWQKERTHVTTQASFAPLSVSFYNPPFLIETPKGFAFTKESHAACVRIVKEVCGDEPESWNGYLERTKTGCCTLSVRPTKHPTPQEIKAVEDRIRTEIKHDMLELLVTKTIPE